MEDSYPSEGMCLCPHTPRYGMYYVTQALARTTRRRMKEVGHRDEENDEGQLLMRRDDVLWVPRVYRMYRQLRG